MIRNKIIALLAIALFAVSALYAQETQVIDKVVAVVGRNIILQSDIESQYAQYRMQGGIKGDAESIRCRILEDLLFQKLMLNQAEIDSITVTDDQVESEMDRRLRYFINEIGSQEKLEAYYNKTINEIKDELRRLITDQMKVEKVQNEIMGKITITPSEVRDMFRKMPKDSILTVNTAYEIAQIIKKPPISIDEKLAVKEQLYKIRKRILDGERFSTLAVLYSEDPGSAKKGGELGFYGRGELYPEFEAVAFSLKDGEISEIVETEAGFHVIQMIERRGEFINVRHILLTPKVSPEALEKAYTQLDSIANLIRKDSITFEEAVKRFSDDENKMNGGVIINQYTGSNLFEAGDLDQQMAFVINKLEVGAISNPVPMKTDNNKDAYRLLTIKRKTLSHKANLKEDYNRIQAWALQQKRAKAVEEWVADRSSKAYIRIDEKYANCGFELNFSNK
jgi:peptidyl-prolyl cis-trans isomerase SurA